MSGEDEEVLLSYGDILLRRRDLLTVHEGEWLNDQIISFYFEHLSAAAPQAELLHTSLAHLLSFLPDQAQVDAMLASLDLRSKDLVLAAVSDSEDVTRTESGSHWSLLVWDNRSQRIYHYDSMPGE